MIPVPFMPVRDLAGVLPAAPHPSVMQVTSDFWTGWKWSEPFPLHPYTWESCVLTHLLLLYGRNPNSRRSLFGTELCCLGRRGDADKVKLLLLLMSVDLIQMWMVFLQQCAGISSLRLLTPTNGLLSKFASWGQRKQKIPNSPFWWHHSQFNLR